jgi:hypothetical protein
MALYEESSNDMLNRLIWQKKRELNVLIEMSGYDLLNFHVVEASRTLDVLISKLYIYDDVCAGLGSDTVSGKRLRESFSTRA